ncbi:hypothetical protein BK130_10230 [Viridibacillus sp. FSL H8-0123]|nr:hypothetical protein BK130_10230 [Viridibacillus sp. FSL H8-0123]OMC89015.1 hypothetical protein BK128_03530 [Viridibacillus sp. FSL H7-0596]OMC93644.1 hypothetical protein BK137_03810 [Viridibacillus arenosi]
MCDFWYFYKLKKKIRVPIRVLVYFLFDLPYVLAEKAKQYKGDCKIVIFDITRGGHTEANFGKNSIMFLKDYQGVAEGNYYCEVEYYPGTEQGKS